MLPRSRASLGGLHQARSHGVATPGSQLCAPVQRWGLAWEAPSPDLAFSAALLRSSPSRGGESAPGCRSAVGARPPPVCKRPSPAAGGSCGGWVPLPRRARKWGRDPQGPASHSGLAHLFPGQQSPRQLPTSDPGRMAPPGVACPELQAGRGQTRGRKQEAAELQRWGGPGDSLLIAPTTTTGEEPTTALPLGHLCHLDLIHPAQLC